MTKKKNKKKTVKEVKKGYIEEKFNTSSEVESLIKIVIAVALIFGGAYGITLLMEKVGVFESGYKKPEVTEAVITYEDALVGTVFNRPEKEYYVVFDEFGDKANTYLSYVLSSYKGKLPIYKVDMTNALNSKYASEKSNAKAQNSSSLKINGITLIKVKNGKNVLYLENIDKIEEEML